MNPRGLIIRIKSKKKSLQRITLTTHTHFCARAPLSRCAPPQPQQMLLVVVGLELSSTSGHHVTARDAVTKTTEATTTIFFRETAAKTEKKFKKNKNLTF